jgi:hypothetical protein
MALLARLAALAALVGCYSPELRDCTVTCAAATDCAADQVCDPDGYCTAPTSAGQCARIAAIDAGTDARPGDANDAPATATLDVTITGDGSVTITGIGACDSLLNNGDCTFTATANTVLSITAVPHLDSRFDKWEGETCKDQSETCSTIARPPITVLRAKFRRAPPDDDDD